MSKKQKLHYSDYHFYYCNSCSENIVINHSYTHTEEECRDNLLSKIEKSLNKTPLFILIKIYNLLSSYTIEPSSTTL